MFLKMSLMESAIFFFFFKNLKRKRGRRSVAYKYDLADYFFRRYYLFKKVHTSYTVKNNENVVKCFGNTLRWRAPNFSQNKEGV